MVVGGVKSTLHFLSHVQNVFLWRAAPVEKKETSSIFSSKLQFSDKSNDSGESELLVTPSSFIYKAPLMQTQFKVLHRKERAYKINKKKQGNKRLMNRNCSKI